MMLPLPLAQAAAEIVRAGPVEEILQQLLVGLTNGMLIGLIALGYTMVYGIIELINFAHGDLFMLGSFLALTLVAGLSLAGLGGVPLALAILLLLVASALFCGTLNVIVDRLAYKPIRHAPRIMLLVTAIGVSFIIQNLGLLWGAVPLDIMGNPAAPKAFPPMLPNLNLLGDGAIRLTPRDAFVWSATIPVMIGLSLFVKRSRLGKAMRAVAQDTQAAQLMGIDVDAVIAWTFFIGGALAGVGSVVYAIYIMKVEWTMGYIVGMRAFTAAVLGGIGNLPGAVVGGIVIGVVSAFSDYYLAAAWTNAVMYGILMILLIFRPAGLLGAVRREKV